MAFSTITEVGRPSRNINDLSAFMGVYPSSPIGPGFEKNLFRFNVWFYQFFPFPLNTEIVENNFHNVFLPFLLAFFLGPARFQSSEIARWTWTNLRVHTYISLTLVSNSREPRANR